MWHPLRAFGFVYYESYVNRQGLSVAWISREALNDRYLCFYCDGQWLWKETRGSMNNARLFISTIVTELNWELTKQMNGTIWD